MITYSKKPSDKDSDGRTQVTTLENEPEASTSVSEEAAFDRAREACTALLMSPRGDYIISQALYIAAEELEKVEQPYREESNITDMRLLTLQFPSFVVAEAAKRGTGTKALFEAYWKLPTDKPEGDTA